MCIRDRVGTGAKEYWPEVFVVVESMRIPDSINFIFVVIICLLYTSDAADERSSVDLGGRRIIKKKKTTKGQLRSRIITNQKHHEKTYIQRAR